MIRPSAQTLAMAFSVWSCAVSPGAGLRSSEGEGEGEAAGASGGSCDLPTSSANNMGHALAGVVCVRGEPQPPHP